MASPKSHISQLLVVNGGQLLTFFAVMPSLTEGAVKAKFQRPGLQRCNLVADLVAVLQRAGIWPIMHYLAR